MNWTFHSVRSTDAPKMIKEYSALAAATIDAWIDTVKPTTETQPEGAFSEFPPGFRHEGCSYSFRFRTYGPGGCMDPDEFDVTVEQTFYNTYDNSKPWGARVRQIIGPIHAIE